ncbi:MAG: glycosyltransferase family 2 protein [Candidatus Nitrohelix vancouverensis]|uniref:dolichyl-phosphate beta-glucosyltransferase n=1 Tax=Candidatus Nitrohelix vancouverensis TaxID=2705534 RepID=A0A7T0G3A6_9BACT|nr:MAG: glycosyltransferase family 2 protein [Candidatus Nitrohelix vancouverensis]
MEVSPYLSVVIPAYNEAVRLRKTLPLVREFFQAQEFTWELVLVDDGSVDGTADILGEFFEPHEARAVSLPANRGKGYAVRTGVLESKGKLVLISDADLSTPLKEFATLQSCLEEGFDVAIGSRSLANSNIVVRQAWYREGMGRFFNFLVQTIALKGFIDTQCGFKCFEREKLLSVIQSMRIDGFSFDVELLYIAMKKGFSVKEVAVEWRHMEASRVRIWIDPARMILDLFKIRCNDLLGRYGSRQRRETSTL